MELYAESNFRKGLQESDKLPEPIYTPSTKAEIGDHDENISLNRVSIIWKNISREEEKN